MEDLVEDTKEIMKKQAFVDSISAIDDGDEDGLAANAVRNKFRAQSLPPNLEESKGLDACLALEFIEIPPKPYSNENMQQIIVSIALAVNTMMKNEQRLLRRQEYDISQGMVHGAIQGLVSKDTQCIHDGIGKMFDNFSIMTRVIGEHKAKLELCNNYTSHVLKKQLELQEQFKEFTHMIDGSSHSRYAEIEKAILNQNKLIHELTKTVEESKKWKNPTVAPIPSYASLHPQTTIQHVCNGNSSPEILEGLKTMSNTIASLMSQIANMQSAMTKMEKQLNGKNVPTISTSHTPAHQTPPTTQRVPTPRVSTPRPPTPRVPTPRPQTPSPPNQQQQAAQVPNNAKPKGAKGRPKLYVDQSVNAFGVELSLGENWFLTQAIQGHDNMIHSWARVISMGNWGYLSEKGFPLPCAPDLDVKCKRNFIILSIMRAFDLYQGCHKLLVPPEYPVRTTDIMDSCNFCTWTHYSGTGNRIPNRRGHITPSFYPGWIPEEVKAKIDFRSKMNNPKTNPNLQMPQTPQAPQPKMVSFANIVVTGTNQQQPTKPNIPEVLQPIQTTSQFIEEPTNSNGGEYGAKVYFEDQYGSLNPNPATFSHNNPTIIAISQSSHRPNP